VLCHGPVGVSDTICSTKGTIREELDLILLAVEYGGKVSGFDNHRTDFLLLRAEKSIRRALGRSPAS
jgi:hypothetical protein